MRLLANYLVTTSVFLATAFAATPLKAADIVYPDGASVTRVITLDLPSGDTTLAANDPPPLLDKSLDKSSLRVEGEAGAKLTIGAIDARPPKPVPPIDQEPAH